MSDESFELNSEGGRDSALSTHYSALYSTQHCTQLSAQDCFWPPPQPKWAWALRSVGRSLGRGAASEDSTRRKLRLCERFSRSRWWRCSPVARDRKPRR